ncbi:hypothetical protein [Pseudomonas sp. HY2-MNA-CIBAN-0224]|uniref:hypothetical protein n=1 Tax=Pseudomonas sp. HY2-MNA-CIBAN-0224 TaxID=3140471 RepID=UPI0033324DC7
MGLNKPTQELRSDLKAAASALEDAAHDLFREAKSYAEPEFLAAMEKISKLHDHADRLMVLAEEVKSGRITRSAKH